MPACSYITERKKLESLFSGHLNVWKDDNIAGKFNIVSAGLRNYLPDIVYKEHERIFKDIIMHQSLSKLEQAYQEALDYSTCENLDNEKLGLLKKGGTIICTFHTGSYRVINQVLVRHHIPFSLVIAKSIIESQGEEFADLHQRFSGSGGVGSFGLIDAESPGSGLQMLRELKKGRNLVLYIDGNTGAGSEDNEKNNLCDIPFLGQRIFARKGIAFLAHVANSPIVPVICSRKSIDDIRLHFSDPIYPKANEARDTFAQNATRQIFDLVAPVIRKYPEQWEAWLYLHRFANVVNHTGIELKESEVAADLSGDTRLMLNVEEFGIFKLYDEGHLLRKSSYDSFAVGKDLYDLLHLAVSEPITKRQMDPYLFSQFYQNNVFVLARD